MTVERLSERGDERKRAETATHDMSEIAKQVVQEPARTTWRRYHLDAPLAECVGPEAIVV